MIDPLLSVRSVSKTYKDKEEKNRVLSGANFDLDSGHLYSLCGPSGSGKTTLLNIISGLDRPDDGEVWFKGTRIDNVDDPSKAKIRSSEMGLVFQNPNLISHLSALENVLLPCLFSSRRGEQDRSLALSLLDDLGLKNKLHKLPRKMSEGEKRRVSVARALITEPKLVLADEPTVNLDSENASKVLDLFSQISQKKESSIFISTHDEEVAHKAFKTWRIRHGVLESQ